MFQQGSRSDGPYFSMIALLREQGPSRLGLAAGRLVGRAVRRNRAKRRLRECFRRNKPVRAMDMVLVAKREISNVTLAELEREFRRRLSGLERQLPRAGRAAATARD